MTLSATMTIAKMMPTVNLKDKTLFYDGSYQYIHFEYPKNLPSYSTATFTLDGQTVSDKMGLKVKDIGTHTVSITLACEKYGYTPTTTTATISVIPQNIGRVDSSKNPLTITNSLKYQQLRSEILKGNFSLEVTTRDDFFYVYTDNSTEEKVTSVTNYYVSNNEMFSFYSMSDKESNSKGNCVLSETEWCHTKVVGDDVLIANYEEGILSTCCKYDSKYYHENIVGQIGIKAMSLLNEDADGGFTQGSEGGYTTSYGDYSIDEANNTFTMTSRNHYYHTGEWNHDEVVVYKLYNIGNTKIDMLDQFNVSGISYDKFEKTHFVHNGIEYFDSKAYVSFDVVDKTYLEKKAYVFSPDAGGTVVTEFADGYYDKYFSHDLTGIEMDVYFDSNGYYCGDYVSYGQIKNYTYLIADLVDLGGTIKYYGEW